MQVRTISKYLYLHNILFSSSLNWHGKDVSCVKSAVKIPGAVFEGLWYRKLGKSFELKEKNRNLGLFLSRNKILFQKKFQKIECFKIIKGNSSEDFNCVLTYFENFYIGKLRSSDY